MRKTKKQSLRFIIVLVLMCLGIGYAYLTTTLSINGITDIDSNSWNIYWNNVQVTTGSVTGDQVTQAPVIDSSLTSVSFHVRLKEPGEYFEFTVDAVNAGTIDGMIDVISSKLNNVEVTTLPEYLNYSVTYSDGVAIMKNQLLEANSTETIKIRVEYKTDIDPSELPSTSQTLSLSLGIAYAQSDERGFKTRQILYAGDQQSTRIGNLVEDGEFFNNYQDAMATTIGPMFIRHKIINKKVEKSDIGIEYNENIYYLISGGSTFDSNNNRYNYDSIYYEGNKDILDIIFGSGNCTEYINTGVNMYITYECINGNDYANISKSGNIYVSYYDLNKDHEYECYVNMKDDIYCNYLYEI